MATKATEKPKTEATEKKADAKTTTHTELTGHQLRNKHLADLASAYYDTHQKHVEHTVAGSGLPARNVMEAVPCGCDLCAQYRDLTEKKA